MGKDLNFYMKLFSKLYPLKRDLISDGYDEAIQIIEQYYFTVKVNKYPTGLKCWTWEIPNKWSCQRAFIKNQKNKTIVNINEDELYLGRYSQKINSTFSYNELVDHLYVNELSPESSKFIFFYYSKNWGFSIPKKRFESLNKQDSYKVVIDSYFEKCYLKVLELDIKGKSNKTFVISSHLDHPFQANDGLSGVITSLQLYDFLKTRNNFFSYKILIGPETIGSIAWLSQNEKKIKNIIGGIFLDMTAYDLPPAIQKSYEGKSQIDKIFTNYIKEYEKGWVADYRFLVGNDERQYNSPGLRIPMISFARANKWGSKNRPFKEYHSSLDNMDKVSEESLSKSFEFLKKCITIFDKNLYPLNKFKGEVFLSGYNLSVNREKKLDIHRNMLKIMDMIDGKNSIFDISKKLKLNFDDVYDFIDALKINNLISLNEDHI